MLHLITIFFSIFFFNPLFGNENQGISFEHYNEVISELKQKIKNDIHLPWSNKRPAKCSIESSEFSDIAKDLSSIALSLKDGKCFEKYSDVIFRLSQSEEYKNNDPLELDKIKDGALIETRASTIISIKNTQVQSVENNNSLVQGLFSVAEDKDCIEQLTNKGKLSKLSHAITKIGAIGFLVPTPMGIAGSSAIMAAGSSLYVLDKILKPSANWKYPKDRRDFLSLTCAFYNIRTQLYRHGFFEAKSYKDEKRLTMVKDSIKKINHYIENLDHEYNVYKENWLNNRNMNFMEIYGKRKTSFYLLIENSLMFLQQSQSELDSVAKRLQLVSYINDIKSSFLSQLSDIFEEAFIQKKIKEIFNLTSQLTPLQALSMSKRTWHLAYLKSITFYLQELSRKYFKDFPERLQDQNYKIITNRYNSLLHSFKSLKNELKMHKTNLKRKLSTFDLDEFSDGSQNSFDIHEDFKSISKRLLGKKGWSFVSYLIKNSKKDYKKFTLRFNKFIKNLKEERNNKNWLCRDSSEIARNYDAANTAVEFAFDFLNSISDLLSTHHNRDKHRLNITRIPNYPKKLARSMRSVEYYKRVKKGLHDYNKSEIRKFSSRSFKNLGKLIYQIKDNKDKRQFLDNFRYKHCY